MIIHGENVKTHVQHTLVCARHTRIRKITVTRQTGYHIFTINTGVSHFYQLLCQRFKVLCIECSFQIHLKTYTCLISTETGRAFAKCRTENETSCLVANVSTRKLSWWRCIEVLQALLLRSNDRHAANCIVCRLFNRYCRATVKIISPKPEMREF